MSRWGYRVCAACGKDLEQDEYSANQWRKGVGNSRCRVCVQDDIHEDSALDAARGNNNSRSVDIDRNDIIGEGTFRVVALGRYTRGQRTGQKCVGKWFKDSRYDFDSFVEKDQLAVETALKIINQWNRAGFIDDKVRMNVFGVWPGNMLVEPYIEGFVKFNSNTGWTNSSSNEWFLVMQALSHYSYHVSSGQFLLCDLQGGIYRDGVILTDPVIQSRRQTFGPTDLGPEGISTFFSRHRCNKFCTLNWSRPRDTHQYFSTFKGTSYATH